jgi:hypothetical protein
MDVWQTCFLVPGLTRPECASWVQAWGSIVAIGAAIWISSAQHRKASELAIDMEARRIRRRYNALLGLGLSAHTHVLRTVEFLGRPADERQHAPEPILVGLQQSLDELDRVNTSELELLSLCQGIRGLTYCCKVGLELMAVDVSIRNGESYASQADSLRYLEEQVEGAWKELAGASGEIPLNPESVLRSRRAGQNAPP